MKRHTETATCLDKSTRTVGTYAEAAALLSTASASTDPIRLAQHDWVGNKFGMQPTVFMSEQAGACPIARC